MYRPSELRAFLKSQQLNAQKALSQNFLIDGNIVSKILDLSQIQAGHTVLEIGPGPGVLTEALMKKGCHVIAVERDERLASALLRFQSPDKRLHIFSEDVLTFSWKRLTDLNLRGEKIKVISNLPYQLYAPILQRFLPRHDLFSDLVVMLQEEVARRIVAKPGSSDYSSFTLFTEYYAKAKYGFTVSAPCFYPTPKVTSAVVKLTLAPPPSLDSKAFFTLTRTAFQQRRKMLRSSLKQRWPHIEQSLHHLGLNPQARPETLSLKDFIRLYSTLGPVSQQEQDAREA